MDGIEGAYTVYADGHQLEFYDAQLAPLTGFMSINYSQYGQVVPKGRKSDEEFFAGRRFGCCSTVYCG
jgi:hypothetical protein